MWFFRSLKKKKERKKKIPISPQSAGSRISGERIRGSYRNQVKKNDDITEQVWTSQLKQRELLLRLFRGPFCTRVMFA